MKWINAEQQVIVTIYDEEHEEHLVKMMSVEEMLDTYTNDGCPTVYSNQERKKGKWEREVLGSTSGYGTTVMYQCSECERMAINQYNYCPWCGADMRGEK